jgi:hypothetical protein
MGWSSQIVLANLVIIEGPHDGLFVYNGTPAAGNLIASIAPAAGTDAYGNSYVGGITTYSASGDVELAAGEIFLFDSSNLWMTMSKAGLFVYQSPGGAGNLIASIAPVAGTDAYGNIYPEGIRTVDAASQRNVTIAADTISLAFVSSLGATIGPDSGASGMLLTGPHVPISLPNPASLDLIPGSATSGISGPHALLGDGVDIRATKPGSPGTVEPWHQVGAAGEPAFQNGWANSGSGKNLAFRLNALGEVDIYGDLTVPATPNTVIFTLPASYQPSGTNEQIDVLVANQAGITRAAVGINGTVTVANMPAGATRIILKGTVYLDL